MKKILFMMLLVFSISQINTTPIFQKTIKSITSQQKTILPKTKTPGSLEITILNDTPNKIIIEKLKGYPSKSNNEKSEILPHGFKIFRTVKYAKYELKVNETKANRSWLKAPIIIANKDAQNIILHASDIFAEKTLPKGYSYKTYATGLNTKESSEAKTSFKMPTIMSKSIKKYKSLTNMN